jgi:TonB-linked SusC/RagA family outer membrane protein
MLFGMAQTGQKVTGRVMDTKNELLIGVNVVEAGTTNGTVTDINGTYTIHLTTQDPILRFTYVGFKETEVQVGKQGIIDVFLQEETEALNEVVVIGYGTQKKISVTGAVSNAEVKQLQAVPAASLSNALGGTIPGIITRQSSGEPGFDGAALYIRGMATLTGFNSPLILVDGVERDINVVNIQEVESFTILKDASATAVYGVQGANGVILITTKKGVQGKPKVTYRGEYATLQGMRFPQYIEAYEFATLMNEAAFNSQLSSLPWSAEDVQKFKDGSDPYLYPNVNWMDEIFKKDTWQTTHNLNVSGGNEVARYYINLGYVGKDGLYKEDKSYDWGTNGGKFRRYNLRSNIDVNVTKDLSIELGLATTIQNRSYQGTSAGAIWSAIRQTSPLIYPVRNPDGSIAGGGTTGYLIGNPYGLATQTGYTQMYIGNNQGNLAARWDLSKLVTVGLSVSGKFAFDHYYKNEVGRRQAFGVKQVTGRDPDGEYIYRIWREQGTMGYSLDIQDSNYSMYWEGALNYARKFGLHDVAAMLLVNRKEYKNLTAGSSINNLPNRHQGLVGRFSYNYGNRYLMEFNFGYNGSEQFPKGNRYGFFPSLSLGWVVSSEEFWNPTVVNNLKIRGSAGKVGSDLVSGDRFLYVTAVNTAATGYWYGTGQTWLGGIEEKKFGVDLVWETSTKYNAGIDIGLFNIFSLQFDAFKERRENILLKRAQLPAFLGLVPHGTPYGNVGIVDNKGFDAAIELKNTTSYGLTYSLRGNFTFARNKIVEDDTPHPAEAYQETRGTSLSQAFALVAEGLFKDQEEIDNWAKSEFQTTIIPGDIKYKDMNEDGVINDKDRVFIGHPQIPEIMFGFGGGLAYKNFDASVQFSGVANRSTFLTAAGMYPFSLEYPNYNVLREYYDNRWVPGTDNSKAKYPTVIAANNVHNNRNSTVYMRDAGYVKLQNAEVGYTFPKEWMKMLQIAGIRAFVNGSNLLTFDKLKIIDPEQNIGDAYPLQRTINFGVQINF